jgi:hypothetical protein
MIYLFHSDDTKDVNYLIGLARRGYTIGITDWYRDGTLAEYVAVEARNLTPLLGDVDFSVASSLVRPARMPTF